MPGKDSNSACQRFWILTARHSLQGAPSLQWLLLPDSPLSCSTLSEEAKSECCNPSAWHLTHLARMQTYVSPAVDKALGKSQGGNNSPGPIYMQLVSPFLARFSSRRVLFTLLQDNFIPLLP